MQVRCKAIARPIDFLYLITLIVLLVAAATWLAGPAVAQAAKKPNIVIIWGDDIGRSNLSTYTEGMMGYHTPNIDRIANEG